MLFPVVMYGCERWTIKKAEHQRTDAFELWCWKRLLRVPWKSTLNIHWKDQCWIWSSNTLGHLMWRADSLEKPWCWERLKAGGEGDGRGWGGLMVSLTWWTWVWASSRSWWWIGKPAMLQSMASQRVRYDWGTGLNWNDNHGRSSQNWFRDSDMIYRNSLWGLPVAQLVKNPPAIQETQAQFLGWGEPLEKG